MRPRVAFVTPEVPSPEDTGGRIRMARLGRALGESFDVSLFASGSAGEVAREGARRDGPLSLFSSRAVRARNPDLPMPSWIPRRVVRAAPPALVWDLWRAHQRAPFDLAVVSHCYAMGLVQMLRGVPVLLDEHNIESARVAEMAAAHGVARRAEPAALARWERRCWGAAEEVTCVSEADAAVVRGHRGRAGVTVVPNGVSLSEVEFVGERSRAARRARDVLFVGLMSFAPNEEGAAFLARRVMPRVWNRVPDARLILCGRQPSPTVQSLAGDRVEVTGTVDHVGPFLSRARVVTVPLAHGAGSSLKAIEALASGAAVVSTSVGMRGIEGASPGVTHEEAEGPEAFADAIVRAFDDERADDHRSARARAVAEAYDWARVGRGFLAVADRAMRRGGRS